jgi:ribonuclease VapC
VGIAALMVIDTSAIVSIIFAEPDAEQMATAIDAADQRLVSAATALEASVVIESEMDDTGRIELDLLIYRARIEIVPFSADQFEIARRAYRVYGRGRHPAGLNLGDCFSYALSKSTGYPLLFKGDDFRQTDVVAAL